MNTWRVSFDKFNPEEESLREALCTLGNGYLGTRGAAPETLATRVHYPGTYVAGVYNSLATEVAGRKIVNEDFVNCPNWLLLNYRIGDGPWFNRMRVKLLSWKVELDMRHGVLLRRIRWQDGQGRITLVENQRIVSVVNPHVAAMSCTITPENYEGHLTIRSGLDGLIINAGVERYKQLNSKHLEPRELGSFRDDGVFLQMRTNESKVQISEALRTLVYCGRERLKPPMRTLLHGRDRIVQEFQLNVEKGKQYTVEKLVSVYTSRDYGARDNSLMAKETVSKIESFESVYMPHRDKWRSLWKRYNIEIEGDQFVEKVLRLHTFHLLQCASIYNDDIDAGIPARGLHGEAYRGHIFWDEMFVLPFFSLRNSDVTRSLLMYRYRRLDKAKENAQKNGYRGAMFPWQSASTGEETTQVVHLNPMSGTWGEDYSSLQRHVSLAIVYNTWTYYAITQDVDFMLRYGGELLLEIAHFWSSAASFNFKKGRYEIKGVMGPDEFHEKYPWKQEGGLDNNAYTNIMSVWVVEKALAWVEFVGKKKAGIVLRKIGIDDDELDRWSDMVKRMFVPMDDDGLLHQFEGYMDLKELDWDEYRNKYENINRMDRILKAEGLSPDDYKVAKQADTLMLFYILGVDEVKRILGGLGYSTGEGFLKKNFDYYLQRTSHGSTLSMIVHSFLAKQVGYHDQGMEYFMEAVNSDINDVQGGTTQEGIHVGVMGGTINVLLCCLAGIRLVEDTMVITPKLPKHWKRLRFYIRHRNVWCYFNMTPDKIDIAAERVKDASILSPEVIPLEVKGTKYQLVPGKKISIQF